MLTYTSIAAFSICAFVAANATQCTEQQPKNEQAIAAAKAAASIKFTDNAEIDNIKKRIELTSKPGLLGFIILLNEAGQPIMYEGVKGKLTSGTKRLTEPDRSDSYGHGTNNVVRAAPSDEGTWGASSPYVFYFNTDGVYRQWSGHYLYSTQSFRLRIEPLVVNLPAEAKP
jgi:hypothetical protein